jgi:predicted RNase H-like nuclease
MVVGIDGCRAGWFAVRLNPDNTWTINVFQEINQIWQAFQEAALILIDIPIGLKEAGHQERQCDTTARRVLGMPRQTSVFPVPCRQATREANHDAAKLTNRRITGRSLSKQTLAITPKIHQVDLFLLANQPAQNIIREIHPEICYWSLSGHQPMQHNKKTQQGQNERMAILQQLHPNVGQIYADALPLNQVSSDDILDAMVGAITAKIVMDNINRNRPVHTLPPMPEIDQQGLRMEMVYAT